MGIVMTITITITVDSMEVTVVDLVSTKKSVQTANVKTALIWEFQTLW